MPLDEYLHDYNSVLYNNPSEVISNAEFLIRNLDNKKNIAETYLLLAYGHFYAGKNDKALENAALANLEALKTSNIKLIDDSEFFLQRIYQRYHLYDFSEKYIAENHSENGISIKASQFFNQGNFGKCIETFLGKKKLTIEEKLILSKAYLKNHQYDKAFQLLQNLNQNDALGLYFKTRIELYLGELYFDKRETDKALNHYKIALILAKKLNHPYLINDVYYNLGSLYLATHSIHEINYYSEKYDSISTLNLLMNQKINNEIFYHQSKIIQLKQQKTEDLLQRLIIFSFVVLFLTILIYGYILNKKKEKLGVVTTILQTIKESKNEVVQADLETKYSQKTDLLSKDKEYALLQKLDSFEKTNKFLSKNVSLRLVASKLDTNTKYLSEVINRHKKKNFNTYINELRIKYILNKLTTDSNYLNYKISYLAEEAGFSSHSSFVSAFKTFTGTTPTLFINTLSQTAEL
ncbi:helix-turn-helix domain-containing protein [Empedobacter falsenii]